MARLLIYDAYENKVYTYANLNENDPMPYSTGTTLRVREFRGKSASPTLWTTIAAMEAWNLTRRKYGKSIHRQTYAQQGTVEEKHKTPFHLVCLLFVDRIPNSTKTRSRARCTSGTG